MKIKTYAVINNNEDIRKYSRSGGIFSAISDVILEQGGVVYGCVLNEKFEAKHVRANSHYERDCMRGSKYIQSDIGESYKLAKKDLENGLKVLFSGTSCQIAGLKNYLLKDYDNLFCVDILCHGVPSPMVWQDYLKWGQKHLKSKLVNVDFRNKQKFGWRDHLETLFGEKGDSFDSKVFTNLFYGEYIVRPSCYECRYADIRHPADITIGDYWGIEKAYPLFDDNKGVSLVLINSEKGETLFDKAKNSVNYAETKIEDSWQQVLKAPFSRPKSRTKFWKEYKIFPFAYIAYKYGDYGRFNKLKNKVVYKANRLLQLVIGDNN